MKHLACLYSQRHLVIEKCVNAVNIDCKLLTSYYYLKISSCSLYYSIMYIIIYSYLYLDFNSKPEACESIFVDLTKYIKNREHQSRACDKHTK